MVRFLSKPVIDEHQASSTPPHASLKESAVVSAGVDPKLVDVSFADSLLNFDVIEEFFEDNQEPDTTSLEEVDISEFEGILGMDSLFPSNETVNGSGSDAAGIGQQVAAKEEALELQSGSIAEDMGRVSLETMEASGSVALKSETGINEVDMGASDSVPMTEASDSVAVKSEPASGAIEKEADDVTANGGETDSDSEEESSSSSSSSSSSAESSSSEDEDEEEDEDKEEDGGKGGADVEVGIGLKLKKQVDEDDVEEGEIRDEEEAKRMVEWSDVDEEDEGDVGVEKGPIRSKNELKALPPVPPVNAALQPHHVTQPVGLVSSVLGTQVIVEGVEKHNPLSEGSIIWLTEQRSPLGLVDEIFGPVKNPFYIVRFNSESEVPEGIHEGTLVSFVPEFADFVLSNQNLYKKGYDASGENDEELSEEIEFSDDEKEAEYRRMQKMSKRGMNGQATVGNKKRNKKKGEERRGDWKNQDKPSWQQAQCDQGNQHNNNASPVQSSVTSANGSTPAVMGQGINGVNSFVPSPFRPMLQQQTLAQHQPMPANGSTPAAMGQEINGGNSFAPPPGFFPPANGNWPNGLFPQNQQNPQFGGFPPNVQNSLMQLQNMLQFQLQQFNPGQGSLLPGNVMPPGQPNFLPGPGFSPWPAAPGGMMNQGCFNNQPPFGMGFQPQPPNPAMMNNSMNMGDQGMMAPGLQQSTGVSGSIQPPQQSGNGLPPQNFNARGGSQQSGNGLPPQNFNAARGGSSSNRGRRPFHRRGGGGRFGGRGGR